MCMVFNDVTTNQGIVQEIDFLVNTDSVKFPISDKTRVINRWLERVVGRILEADGRWQWDDTNYTVYPIATTDLTAGQQDYVYNTKHVRITRMEIKDENGNWKWLEPIDQNDTRYRSLTELGNQTGVPCYYDKLSQSVFLYPRPSYNSTGGLKVYYQRNADPFVVTDTTKEPGFAAIFHRLLALGPAYEYAIANNLNSQKIGLLKAEIAQLEQDIKEFYSKRSKDEQLTLRVSGAKNASMWR